MLCKIDQKSFWDAFNEDVDLAVATETPARVETQDRAFTTAQNVARTYGYFFLDASAAKRAHCATIFANQHARSRPSIA